MAKIIGPIFEGGVDLGRVQDGDSLTYKLDITGLADTKWDGLAEALSLTGVPILGGAVYGDTNGVFAPLRCSSISPEFIATDAIRLTFTHTGDSSEESGGGTGGTGIDDAAGRRLSFGSTIQQIEANTDINGDLATVTYSGASTNGLPVTQSGTFQTGIAQSVLTVTIRKTVSPVEHSKLYTNTYNTDSVILMETTYLAGELLCTSVTGTTDDNQETWDTSYQFAYAPAVQGEFFPIGGTFRNQTIYWRDLDTGKPPPDVAAGGGIKTVTVRLGNSFTQMEIWDGTVPPSGHQP